MRPSEQEAFQSIQMPSIRCFKFTFAMNLPTTNLLLICSIFSCYSSQCVAFTAGLFSIFFSQEPMQANLHDCSQNSKMTRMVTTRVFLLPCPPQPNWQVPFYSSPGCRRDTLHSVRRSCDWHHEYDLVS